MNRLLDLFCGAGGCTRGYQMAGYRVTGVDIAPQAHYVGEECIQADALVYVQAYGHEYDVIHASPPCQAYSQLTPMAHRSRHPRLIGAIQEALRATGRPYVIENVPNARKHLMEPFMLCGSMFDLPIWRHRFFETNAFPFPLVLSCNHGTLPVLISGTYRRKKHGIVERADYSVAERRAAIGIDWMVDKELDEAIPPAYTEWIGHRIRNIL